jgi:SAM-dependent methyltransferase
MRREFLDLLCCPQCRGDLCLEGADRGDPGAPIESGRLVCQGCGVAAPIAGFVPRFVPADNYAATFGFQWNRFRKTQLDSHTGVPISAERFFEQSGWSPGELSGKRVLDVGCGAGRFAEVALGCGARLVALDYSSAVDACYANHSHDPRLEVVQGDVYRLPFKPGSFDFVYCFGVLQHTPDVRGAFMALPEQLAPGGRLAVDVYPRMVWNLLWPKFWLRPITRRMSQQRLFALVEKMVAVLLPVSVAIGRLPLVGRKLRFAVPVINYDGVFPLSRSQLREWSILDTYDMLAAAHDDPQSSQTLASWLDEAGLEDTEVFRRGVYVGRGTASSAEDVPGPAVEEE